MAQPPAPEQITPQRLTIEDSVLVDAPIEEVYQQWGDLNHFPDFMRNIISVTPIGDDRYHWIASFFGQRQEWDAAITAREEQRHVAWKNVGGDEQSGELRFAAHGPTTTEVRLRLEVTPPQGMAQQRIDKLAQNARKNTHNDLRRYGQQMKPRPATRGQREGAPAGGLSAAAQVGVAMAAAGVGGYAAYLASQRLQARRTPLPAPLPVPLPAPRAVARPAAIASWSLLGASGASIAGAGVLRQLGKMNNALFVGQWAPTLLAAAGLARALGHGDPRATSRGAIASWSLLGGSVGSVAASAALHTIGRRKQGLFVGQWAPTLMSAAFFARLLDQM